MVRLHGVGLDPSVYVLDAKTKATGQVEGTEPVAANGEPDRILRHARVRDDVSDCEKRDAFTCAHEPGVSPGLTLRGRWPPGSPATTRCLVGRKGGYGAY